MARSTNNGPSMVDVAREAGVSLKTVSRVMNEPDAVRPATRDAVQTAMERLGFRTNYAARSLKLGKYKSIGLVIFELKGGNLSVLDGIASAAAEKGYAITLLKRRDGEDLTLAEAARRMALLPVDGMVFNLGRMVADFDEFRSPAGLTTVIVTPFEHASCPTISDDQVGAARTATERMIELGHREIRFIAGPEESLAGRNRERGWREAMAAAGLEAAEPLRGDWGADSGYEAGARLAADAGCTAILAGNDNMAYGAVCALRDAGRDVPGDVSVVGFDDSLGESVPRVQLASMRFNHHELGIRAFEEVLAGGAGSEKPAAGAGDVPRRVLVPATLIERASLGPRHS